MHPVLTARPYIFQHFAALYAAPLTANVFALVRLHATDQQRFARFNEKSLTELNFHFKITQNIVNAGKNR